MGDLSREEISNTLRVLVATDCHLGYMEKDEIRRHDSFQAFEEICSIAEQKQVDFLLLGGDLFHENKPSRTTLVKAIEILRRHCLNNQPVQFQVVSDQTVNFPNTFGHVNYEDPHFNVGLPVFSIHGNHDDPAGVDNLSAVDILSACNLVNYFGKMVLGGSGVGQIALHPILIRKGSTAVALYGLGNIRDERLNRMFQTPHAVQWMRPEAQEGCQVSDWFNILVLHQNRVKTNPKNAINEHFLPRFLDFVVWGHEHECLVDPQEVPGMGFHITQPGSSVATSLIDGESKPKHVLLLEIKGNQYRPTKIPLTTVRPFEYTEIILKDEPDIDPNDQNSILEHLDEVVRNLIEKSSKKASNRSELKLPLVRIKVDYSGFMTINPQRFGQKYVGKVANPQDILIFSKASRKGRSEATHGRILTLDNLMLRGLSLANQCRIRDPIGHARFCGEFGVLLELLAREIYFGYMEYAKIDDSERFRPEELNQQNIEALVAENNLKMEILPVNDLAVALQNFVNKDDKMAFYSCLRYNLEETRNKIAKDADTLKFEEEDLILKVGECLEERVKERSARPKDTAQFTSTSQSLGESRSRSTAGLGSAVSFSDDEDTTQLSGSKSSTRGRRGSSRSSRDATELGKSKTSTRGRGRGRGASNLKQTTLDASLGFRRSERSASVAATAAVQSIADDEDNVDSASSEEAGKYGIEEVDDSENDAASIQGKGRKRAAPRGRGRGSAQSSKRGRKSDNTTIQRMLMSKDDDDDDDDAVKRLNKSQPRVTRNYGALRR
uniref:Double-strand break repair protein n=1 Tax=Quercus lobata TaxID=97700 RepID=A0A7N2M8M2_QUELO